MQTKVIATKLEEWAAENSPANAYPNEPENYYEAFPIVACKITEDQEFNTTPSDYAQHDYQQTRVQVISADLSILVDPEPAWTSDQQLYDIVDQLKEALRNDSTLGQRVEEASPIYRATYEGDVQTGDGTHANLAIFRMTLAQKVVAT